MTKKEKLVNQVIDQIGQLAKTHETITGLSGIYVALGYPTAGTDPITQADLDTMNLGITLVQFNAAVLVLNDFLAFSNGTAVSTKDRKIDMNRIRRD
jgi:hypothetical protein